MNTQQKPSKTAQTIMAAMFDGYGPDFAYRTPEALLHASSSLFPRDTLQRLMQPFPALGRYATSTGFLQDVTSSYALGRKRYRLFAEKFIFLSRLMDHYKGINRRRKLICGLTQDDEYKLLSLGQNIHDDILAEKLEGVTDQDTAAYADAFKILIYHYLPHLAKSVEAVHNMDTSEDNWGNVMGLTLSELFFGHLVTAYLDFAEFLLDYADTHKNTGVWDLPGVGNTGTEGILLVPAFTHWQASTNSTHVKKTVTVVKQIVDLLFAMTDGDSFVPFTGKFGGITGTFDAHFAVYPDID